MQAARDTAIICTRRVSSLFFISVQAAKNMLIKRTHMVRSLLTIYVQPVRHEIDPLTMAQALHNLVTNLVFESRCIRKNKNSRIWKALTLFLRQLHSWSIIIDPIAERFRGKARLHDIFRQALLETFKYTPQEILHGRYLIWLICSIRSCETSFRTERHPFATLVD